MHGQGVSQAGDTHIHVSPKRFLFLLVVVNDPSLHHSISEQIDYEDDDEEEDEEEDDTTPEPLFCPLAL